MGPYWLDEQLNASNAPELRVSVRMCFHVGALQLAPYLTQCTPRRAGRGLEVCLPQMK